MIDDLIYIDETITDDMLEKHGWTVECESPLEIRHEDGSFATGQAAQVIIDSLSQTAAL